MRNKQHFVRPPAHKGEEVISHFESVDFSPPGRNFPS